MGGTTGLALTGATLLKSKMDAKSKTTVAPPKPINCASTKWRVSRQQTQKIAKTHCLRLLLRSGHDLHLRVSVPRMVLRAPYWMACARKQPRN